jgi:hypothetical protein
MARITMDTSREYQQDERIREIMSWMHTVTENDHIPEFVAVAQALLERISPHTGHSPLPRATIGGLAFEMIDGFAQDPAERMFLTGRLLTRVCESITMRTSHAWVVQSLTTGQADPTAP